ncbi:AI-2E family transporter [Kovacikia minuta CCNUW1]|uniref:AI-2E family transporter n=1 Tax=Kovacikia minuta TaxID=2931930 RepID=UPI001CC905F1|nr:AI-2E family transporter [Kovacikia minuta]UBF26851.1 AI-2E family transporter [Kovacikia minuta CCNUW1]
MSTSNQDSLWYRLTHGAPFAVMVAAALYILYQLLPVLKLVAVAALIAVVLRTLLRWLEKLVKPRWVAVFILAGLITGFAVFLIAVVFPNILDETQQLLVALPAYLNSLIELSMQLHSQIGFIPDLSQGLAQFRNFTDQVLSSFPLVLGQTFGATIELVAMLILAFYMAYDPRSMINGILRLVPRCHHQRFNRLLKETGVRLRGWIFGTGIAMLFLGASATIGLWLLGIPLALSFGVIAGLLEIIPYFGSIAGTFLPALIALTISPLKFLLVVLLFLVLNQVDAYIVQPLVMGQHVRLHPVIVILTFLVMGKLLGFVGVLLAVPAAAIIVTLIDEFTLKDSPTPS